MKNKIFVIAAALVAVVIFVALAFQSKPAAVAPAVSDPMVQTAPVAKMELLIRPHSPSMGNTMARVTVVEWFDPECESCKVMHPVFKKIVSDYKDRVHFVLRYMPYHNNSIHAASALEEAKELGKFDAALDILFEKQAEWGDHQNPKPELIGVYLEKLGIPKAKLGKEYLIKKHESKIRMDESDGNQVGVRGTPSFLVNGQLLPQLGEEFLRTAIDKALAEAK